MIRIFIDNYLGRDWINIAKDKRVIKIKSDDIDKIKTLLDEAKNEITKKTLDNIALSMLYYYYVRGGVIMGVFESWVVIISICVGWLALMDLIYKT